MVLYYDPLYFHTHRERRLEVCLELEEQGMENLKKAIESILAEAPPPQCLQEPSHG